MLLREEHGIEQFQRIMIHLLPLREQLPPFRLGRRQQQLLVQLVFLRPEFPFLNTVSSPYQRFKGDFVEAARGVAAGDGRRGGEMGDDGFEELVRELEDGWSRGHGHGAVDLIDF